MWHLAVLAVTAVALVAALIVSSHRTAPTFDAAGASAAMSAADASREAARPLRVLTIGDSYTGGSGEGGNDAAGWPSLVEADLSAAGYNVQLVKSAAGGSGYVTVGPTGSTFVDLASQAAASGPYDLVVFFGSRNDTAPGDQVQTAATEALGDITSAAPGTPLLVIGPPWVSSDFPDFIVSDRDAAAAASAQAGATFVDPLAEDWFGGDFSSLIGSDGIHPTDAGHRHLADLIRPRVEQALVSLGAAPASPAS